MKFLFASDSFKGTLSSQQTAELLAKAARTVFGEDVQYSGVPVADGGEGTADAVVAAENGGWVDEAGWELEGRGEDLEKVRSIDVSELDPRVKNARITVMCDVTNPLCGPNGATWTFGAQKGATPEIQTRLEAGMVNYRDLIRRQFNVDPDAIPGAGAAGGLGTALTVFLGGVMKSGIDTVLDLIDFDRRLEGTDLVVTGEGRTDWQSCFGKVMQGVGERARSKGVVAVGLSGSLGRNADQIFDHGIASLMTTVDAPMPLEEALGRAEELYYLGAVRMFRFLQAGMWLAK